jgi:hypothetical protein
MAHTRGSGALRQKRDEGPLDIQDPGTGHSLEG